MASGYFVGLTAQPNLFSQIYASKQARADADRAKKDQEAAEKYAKDADKFRIDYSKIHPYHAKEAKMAVAEFMSKADELKKQFPHTYSNTEEYNNAFFNTTSKLEDLTGSSKVIYDEQKLRLEHPDKYETDPNMMKGINEANNAEVSKMLGGRNLFQYGDIAMERWDEQAAAKAIIDKTAQDELLKKDANGKVITTPVGGGTEDIYMTAVKTLNSPQLQKNTLDMWNSSPAMKRKYKTEQEALDWSKGFAEQGTKEITSAIYHNTGAGSGNGQAIQQSLSNNGQGHSLDFGITGAQGQINYRTNSPMKLSIVPTNTVISASENTFNKQNGNRIVGGKPQEVTVGEIAVVPIYKSTGNKMTEDLFKGRVASKEDVENPAMKGKIEYKVIYTGQNKNGQGVYGDIEQVESALFSKESPITDKEVFTKTLSDMKAEAKKLNKENGSSKQGSQQSKTLSSGRVVYSDDGGKTWHP